MGSLENGVLPLKRDPLLKSLSRNERNRSFGPRPRSRFARFMVFKKLDYLQWICAVAVFILFMFVFQMLLPLSTLEKANGGFLIRKDDNFEGDFKSLFQEISGLDFGEGVKFEPTRLLLKFQEDNKNVKNLSFGGSRKPQLAFVFADLLVDPQQVLMVSVAAALRAIGYEIEVYSLEDGPVHAVWKNVGVPVNIVEASGDSKIIIDWLNYDAILVNSLEAKDAISGLLQEPFKSLPLIWTVHEKTLATRYKNYVSDGQFQLIDDWKTVFNRATVVVFPNHVLPMYYAAFDAGNFFVIPGSPSEACKLDNSMVHEESLRVNMNFTARDFVIAITGSQFLYKGLWVEHALVLQALSPLLAEFPIDDRLSQRLRIIILSQDLTGNYSAAIEEIASNLNYPRGTVNHAVIDDDDDVYNVLSIADLVIYGLFLEEQSFPNILVKAMCFEKPIIAPDLSIIKKYVRDRSEQLRGKWEDVYRSAKRAERSKNALHERDDGELERTGQPLCIYEPYFGQGAWPFLHQGPLYRGLGLSTKGRRSRDDIDAPSRLPLLSIPYYRNALGDFGAFFAIANRIDRTHKNAWIGFSSWRATAKKASLSKAAEVALLDDIQSRRHGDALYFWVRMDRDPRNPMQQDFWTFCDAINAGNCKFAFSEALKNMYGLRGNLTSLPPMPADGDSWSVMHSWTMPTKSFVEFVMFSRMFVDALDAQVYEEHHQSGFCYLSLSKDKQCYSRVLELLVNVWAYHSARRMVYIDPTTGTLEEQHNFKTRRGKMWIKWFNYKILKTMDEDLAEEADSDHPKQRWLWPSTGEVFWQGMYEKEKSQMRLQKQKRKQKSKDRIQRIKNRSQQKALGTYVKPPPNNETVNNSNPVLEAVKLLR